MNKFKNKSPINKSRNNSKLKKYKLKYIQKNIDLEMQVKLMKKQSNMY